MIDLDKDTVLADVRGHKMRVLKSDAVIGPALLKNGRYDRRLTELIERIVEPGWTCVDVGAHIGYFTCLLSERSGPSGRVIAFEPEKRNFCLLTNNVMVRIVRGKMSLHNYALSDVNSRESFLWLNKTNTGNHRLWPISDGKEERSYQRVKAKRYDRAIRRELIIDFAKIDVEGAEGLVLEGIGERWPERMAIEWYPKQLIGCGSDPAEVWDMLSDHYDQIRDLKHPHGVPDSFWLDATYPPSSEKHTNLYCSNE